MTWDTVFADMIHQAEHIAVLYSYVLVVNALTANWNLRQSKKLER